MMGALLLLVLAGALLCNAIPHLVKGLCGEAFPTPFARPRGEGLSSPGTNFLWGTANLFAGIVILLTEAHVLGTASGLAALAGGFVVLGYFCSRHFAAARAKRGQ